MYGLPHAGKIAQDNLIARLSTHGYLQTGTTCLFRHVTNGVAFTLVVDDFGVKFPDTAGADDLIHCLQLYYTLTIKKNATKYLGLTIAVDKIARACLHRVSLPRPCNASPLILPQWLDLLPSTNRLVSVPPRTLPIVLP